MNRTYGDHYALVLESPRHLVIHREAARRQLSAGEALIESNFVALCGTDIEVIDGVSDRTQPPVVLGHEWAGRVAATGEEVDPGLTGEFVVGENLVGNDEIGFELPGAFASHFRIPARNLHPLPAAIRGPAACLIEPLAVSVRAVRAARLRHTDSVLVIGDGVVGLFVARLASLSGAGTVMLVGKHDDRLEVARRLGVERVSRPGNCGTGWSVVFEASGSTTGIDAGLEAAGNAARIILAGDYGRGRVAMATTTVVRKELQMIGTNASSGAWAEAVDLAANAAVDLSVVTQLVLPFDRWQEAVQAARERQAPRVVLRH